MKKIKKYFLGSLSLGLIGISAGAILASCGINDAADPASSQSITTNFDDPLTDQQKTFLKTKSDEVKTAVDADLSLASNASANKSKIEENIKNYKESIQDSSLKSILDEAVKTANFNWNTFVESGNATIFYNSFSQKNLLPSDKDSSSLSDKKSTGTLLAIFYSDPKDIILLNWNITLLANNDYTKMGEDRIYVSLFGQIYNSGKFLFKPNTPTSAAQAWSYYEPILDDVQNAIGKIIPLSE